MLNPLNLNTKGYYVTNVYFFNMLITVLSLTIFAFEATKAQNRIGGTFTLILTRFELLKYFLFEKLQKF